MLVFSGLGSLLSERVAEQPNQAMALVCGVAAIWCLAAFLLQEPLILATLDWPLALRGLLLLAAIAPLSIALGLPFPLGLNQAGTRGFLPWAWGLNGAFSVVATPLANLIAREAGFSRVLMSAAILYGVALVTFPAMRKHSVWHPLSARSPAAD